VLDEVDAHGALDLRAVGQLFGVSRERIRQIEEMALVRLRRHAGRLQ
jgi:DNA-directed RNA polymerase sigma subunit (sigma70/sigma32)